MIAFSAHIQAWLNEPMMKQLTTKEQMDRVLNQKIQSLAAQFNDETPFSSYLFKQKPFPSELMLNLGYLRSAVLLEEYLTNNPVRLLVLALKKKNFFMANQLIKIFEGYGERHKEAMTTNLIRYASQSFREEDFPSPLTPSFTEFMNTLLSLDLPKLEQVRLVTLHDLYHKKSKPENDNLLTLFHSNLAKQAKRLGYDCCTNQERLNKMREGNKKFR